jgi:hypothetical protein
MTRAWKPALALAGMIAAAAAAHSVAGVEPQAPSPRVAPQPSDERVEVPPPPFTDGVFPCSGCHADIPVNRARRELTDMHADIVLRHDEQHRWCLDCHDAANRDVLHLASGEPIAFEESYLLCGQCHGEKLRDWRVGVHGRRTGQWNGRKSYLLCAHCHNPHAPAFQRVAPMPAPRRPSRPGAAPTAQEAR